MTVKEIIKAYLKAHPEYDGLAGDNCGCSTDNLMCCWGEGPDENCVAGHLLVCTPSDACDECQYREICETDPDGKARLMVAGKRGK